MKYFLSVDITPVTRTRLRWYERFKRSMIDVVVDSGLTKLSDSKLKVTRYLNDRSKQIYKITKSKNIDVFYRVKLNGRDVKHESFKYKLK